MLKLEELAKARKWLETITEEWRLIVDAHSVKKEFESARAAVAELEADVRSELVKMHEKTGEKKFEGGCGIRIRKKYVYEYLDALDWAIERGLCLKLDTSVFDEACKIDKLRPDFVGTEDIIVPVVPRKLDV